MSDKKWIGLFSPRAYELRMGSSIYSTPDGKEVEVTCVCEEKDISSYKWEDTINLGEVLEWKRVGQQSSMIGMKSIL